MWLNSCAIRRHARSRSIESTASHEPEAEANAEAEAEAEAELLLDDDCSPLDVLRSSASKLVREEREVLGMPMKKSGRYLHANRVTCARFVHIEKFLLLIAVDDYIKRITERQIGTYASTMIP